MAVELLDAAHELELDLLQHQLVRAIQQTMSQASAMFWAEKLAERKHHQIRGSWMDIVDHHVVHFLTRSLPDQLQVFRQPHQQQQQQQQQQQMPSAKDNEVVFKFGSYSTIVQSQTGIRPGMIELAHVYAGLPLQYMKQCLEYNDLTDMVQRYHLALQVIHCREQMGKSELMVVLRFQGKEEGSEISILKKQALRADHWKP
ncbi:hypothetical protein BX666DRAFT_1958122 [Dichotomocladium elegans]|nr:hypothetical protein BX666DRAFT_1958122 [Dichotomocladium elegans]